MENSNVQDGKVSSLVEAALKMEKHPSVKKVIMVCLAGSKAYGTSTPTSDTDIRGVFIPVKESLLTPWNTVREVSITDAEDGKLYEVSNFMKLFCDMNPNIIELMFVRKEEVLYATDEYWKLREECQHLLTKNVAFRFSGYAMSQLKRISGHDKWINNPQPVELPTQKEFIRLVYSYMGTHSLTHKDFMRKMENMNDFCMMIPYGGNIYAVVENHRADQPMFNSDGSIRKVVYEDLDEADLNQKPIFIVKYLAEDHRNAKTTHHNYWEWKANRNAARHELEVKFGYDTKHAMHLVRLMRMAKEILETGQVHVFRPDADELLAIRNGKYTLEDIVKYATLMDETVRGVLYQTSSLPSHTDIARASKALIAVLESGWSD